MTGKMRKITKGYRDRILSPLAKKIDDIDLSVSNLDHAIQALKTDLLRDSLKLVPISPKLIIVKIFSGLKMCLNPEDVAVVPHLALDGIWEESTTIAWQSVLEPDQVVMDIGANFGYYGLLAAQRYPESKEEKVIFFEANPNLIPYIDRTLSINGLHRLSTVENLAVTETEGKATLTVLKDFLGSSSLHTIEHLSTYLGDKMPLEAQEEVSVNTTSIDGYCKSRKLNKVNLIKLDIEGFEEKAYQGMRNTVESNEDLVIFLEFTKESYENPRKFYKKLTSDFAYLYLIDQFGNLYTPLSNDYNSVIENEGGFMMLVLSKRSISGV